MEANIYLYFDLPFKTWLFSDGLMENLRTIQGPKTTNFDL